MKIITRKQYNVPNALQTAAKNDLEVLVIGITDNKRICVNRVIRF